MNPRHHMRTASQGRKPPSVHHAKPGKPAAMKRGHSHNSAHAQSPSHPRSQSQNTSRPSTASKKHANEGRFSFEDDSDMSSFLQFCATCEKQIVTPGISILYCSEACRKKDISNAPTPHSPSLHPSTSYFDYPSNDIIPQRSPTVLPPLSFTFSDLPTASDFAGESDESIDPLDRRGSEESQFWYRSESDSSLVHYGAARRPRGSRFSTATDGSLLPSLIHSPSSSYSTAGSIASYHPLPPRHSHSSSTSVPTTKSVDLVIPFKSDNASSTAQWLKDSSLKSSASTLTSFRVAEATELSYERRTLNETPKQEHALGSSVEGSLKQLFGHSATKTTSRYI